MAGRIRSVKPEWREDERMVLASPAARALSICLILEADDYGRGVGNPDLIVSRNFPAHIDEGRAGLHELLDMQFITLYQVRGQTYFQIRNWAAHQRVDKPGKPKVPGPCDDSRESRESLAKTRESLAPDRKGREGEREGEGKGIGGEKKFSRTVAPPPSEDGPREPQDLAKLIGANVWGDDPGAWPDYAPDRLKAWATELDRAHRLDGRSWPEMAGVLAWGLADEWWNDKITSGKFFRKNYDTLALQAKRRNGNGAKGKNNHKPDRATELAERARRIRERERAAEETET